MTTAENEVFRLRILLQDTPVWREVLVPSSITMTGLHRLIQAVMGWTATHEWEVRRGRDKVSDDGVLMYELSRRGSRLLYTYDFGDMWVHQVVLLDKVDRAEGPLPVCTGGEMATPPEDCGGVPGYQQLVSLKGKKRLTAEEKKRLAWAGDWDPDAFDLDGCNRRLSKAFMTRLAKVADKPVVAQAPGPAFSPKQGQYLSYIFWYTRLQRQAPAESDMQRFFGVTAPAVHQMVTALAAKGLVERKAGQARSLKVLVSEENLPRLEEPSTPMIPVGARWVYMGR